MRWTVEQPKNRLVTVIRAPMERRKDWEFNVLLTADRHLDHPDSQKGLIKYHLKQALDSESPNLDFGDLFCAMQGRHDKRRAREATPNFNAEEEAYFDYLVESNYEFLKPYSEVFAMFGLGNHETGISKHIETSLLRRLIEKLQSESSPVFMGGYRGWVKFLFYCNSSNYKQSLSLYYVHGKKASRAPVTKGAIQSNRRAVYIQGADFIVSGHTHESLILPLEQIGITDGHREYSSTCFHISVPSYKKGFVNKTEGWEVEREMEPKPVGACWLQFKYSYRDDRIYGRPIIADK